MCAIVGRIGPGIDAERVRRASASMAHRGPDGDGLFARDGVCLAARRLAIMDLEHGAQPVHDDSGRVHAVFNGEIMNAADLRRELTSLGRVFRTHCDSEVVAQAYAEWGADAIARFRGFFALAVWDARSDTLCLARDRFGMKPLYLGRAGDALGFASEPMAVLDVLPELPRRVDRAALHELFRVGVILVGRSAFEGVGELPPAHLLLARDGAVTVREYWRLDPPRAGEHEHPHDADTRFRAWIDDAVTAWRVSDVPVAALLSGGIDSATVCASLARRQILDTFSLGFWEARFDEAPLARELAVALGTRHHESRFVAWSFDRFPELVRAVQRPLASPTPLASYALYRAVHAAGFKVAFNGQGSDELLGGYDRFARLARVSPLLRLPPLIRRGLAVRGSWQTARLLRQASIDPVHRYVLLLESTPPARVTRLLGSTGPEPVDTIRDQVDGRLHGLHPVDQHLLLESRVRLPAFITRNMDAGSMATSVEVRPPFLDHHLWEACARLPPHLKVRPWGGKRLLRRAMRGVLPEPVRRRRKWGLSTPVARWWDDHRMPDWVEERLTPDALRAVGLFDAAAVAEVRAMPGGAWRGLFLTRVLSVQLWFEAFLGGAPPDRVRSS